MPSPISATFPLRCPAEAVPVGAAAVSPWEGQQPTACCSPVDSTGEMHFEGAGSSLSRVKGRAEHLWRWLPPLLPTGEQQRRLVCLCA